MGETNIFNHGFGFRPDGNRMYIADMNPGEVGVQIEGVNQPNGMAIFDTSEVQARQPGAQIYRVGAVYWGGGDGAAGQHGIWVSWDGVPHVLWVDELGRGGARIIDISDETHPRVVSKLKLEIQLPENADLRDADEAAVGASGSFSFLYEGHYCTVDRQVDPTTAACGYFQSGVRVFDIRNPLNPREIAYYNPPAQLVQADSGEPLVGSEHGGATADWCSSPPHFVEQPNGEHQLWVHCQDNGFMVLRFTNGAYPLPEPSVLPALLAGIALLRFSKRALPSNAPSRWRGRRIQGTVVGVIAMLGAFLALISTTSAASAQTFCSPLNPPRHPPGNPMLVTEECVDPRYNDPYILVDEVRSLPVPHRFVHGGWSGTPARFAFYFPDAEQYQGRFYQGPTHQLRSTGEIASDTEIQHAFASGAYLVLTNPLQDYALTARDAVAGWGHPDSSGYRVDAAAAKFSRVMAAQIYGYAHRPYGYVYGGSGGAFQTIAKAEWTIGIWDGFVPFVIGHPLASPDHFTVRLHAKRVLDLRNKFPEVLDAIDPGGSGDPYAILNEEEAAALREAHRMGFPPRAWYQHASISGGFLFLVAGYVPLLDPTYVDDFWTQPGYLGHDDPYGSITAARIQHPTTVTAASAVVPPPDYNSLGPSYNTYLLSQYATGPPRVVRLASVPAGDLTGASLVMVTGSAAGKFVQIGTVDRNTNTITFGGGEDPNLVNLIAVGDQVRVDNSFYLALQTHPRHQVTDQFGELSGWNQFRNPDATPIYPQRPDTSPGEYNSFNAAGSISTGRIRPGNKVIVVENLMDIEAFAWSADWYRAKVLENLDPGESLDDHFRLWFTDHAEHGFADFINPPGAGRANTRTVGYTGVLQQALRDLSAWAEQGVPPPDNTSYQVVDSQIVVPATAADRKGIQPVPTLTVTCGATIACANNPNKGGKRVDVAVDQPVTFNATIQVPPGTGKVVAAEWDFDENDGSNYPAADQPADPVVPAPMVNLQRTHSYSAPGTYFATVRATSQREGDPATPYGRIDNIDWVRVVVVPEPDLAVGLMAGLALVTLLRHARARAIRSAPR